MKHRSKADEANGSGEGAAETSKPYTADQLDAVKK